MYRSNPLSARLLSTGQLYTQPIIDTLTIYWGQLYTHVYETVTDPTHYRHAYWGQLYTHVYETGPDPTHYRHAYCLLDNCTHMNMKQVQIQPIIDTLTVLLGTTVLT